MAIARQALESRRILGKPDVYRVLPEGYLDRRAAERAMDALIGESRRPELPAGWSVRAGWSAAR